MAVTWKRLAYQDELHSESHDIASHSDTSATGAELNSLTDNSVANSLHRHSELVASDGIPDPALSVDTAGNVGIGTTEPTKLLTVGTPEATTSPGPDKTIAIFGDGAAYFVGRDTTNDIEFIMGASVAGVAFMGSMTAHDLQFRTSNNTKMVIKNNGNVGIGTTTSPSEKLDVNSDAIRIRTAQTPASAGAAGAAGMICWDADYIYVCVATDTWKRTAIATW